MAAIGRFVLAGKEKLCLIRPMGDALALETLFVHEDVKDHAEIDDAVSSSEVREPELDLAKQIIASLAARSTPPSCAASTASRCARCSRRSSPGTRSRCRSRGADARDRPDGGVARVCRGVLEEGRAGRGQEEGRGVWQEDGRGPEVASPRRLVPRGQRA